MFKYRSLAPALVVLVAPILGLGGCISAPEHCQGCLSALADAAVVPPTGSDGGIDSPGTGGVLGTGGVVGTGGRTGSGGVVGSGGVLGSGGVVGSGGMVGTGGRTGSGGLGSGGVVGTGGAGTGGAGTGGAGTGGAGTGGAGTGGAGTSGAGTGGATIDPDLVLWYRFDEASGTAASDSSGNGRTGTLTNVGSGSAAFTTTHQVGTGAVNMTGSSATVGGYVAIPANLQAMGATTAITISCWVNVGTPGAWQRAFDFGSNTTAYMFLSVQQGVTNPSAPRFGITTTGNGNEQDISMTTPAALSTGVWHHLAVVLGAGATYTGTLYIDNVAVGSNAAMTLRPSNLGNSTNNWIGRSQFSNSDPLFNGRLDDFRVYKRALTATEIATLFAVR